MGMAAAQVEVRIHFGRYVNKLANPAVLSKFFKLSLCLSVLPVKLMRYYCVRYIAKPC